MLTYADVCERMLTYAHVCLRQNNLANTNVAYTSTGRLFALWEGGIMYMFMDVCISV